MFLSAFCTLPLIRSKAKASAARSCTVSYSVNGSGIPFSTDWGHFPAYGSTAKKFISSFISTQVSSLPASVSSKSVPPSFSFCVSQIIDLRNDAFQDSAFLSRSVPPIAISTSDSCSRGLFPGGGGGPNAAGFGSFLIWGFAFSFCRCCCCWSYCCSKAEGCE